MLFREVIAKFIVGFALLGLGVWWMLWDQDRQALYDKFAGMLVVDVQGAKKLAEMSAAAAGQ